MGSGAPRSQLFVKVEGRASVLYGVDATVSDILTVNAAGVIDVFSLQGAAKNNPLRFFLQFSQ